MNLPNHIKRLSLLFLLTILCNVSYSQTGENEYGEILYICAYNSDTTFANEIMDDILKGYNNFGGSYPIATEAMNCHSLLRRKEWMPTLRQILDKHPFAKAIILYGTEAWACYFSLTEEKYKQLPVICLASQRYAAVIPESEVPIIAKENKQGTGLIDYLKEMEGFNVKGCYYYDYGIKEEMELMLKLFPKTQNVAIISDNTFSGVSMFNFAKAYIKKNHSKLNIIPINGQEQSMEDASELMSDLPENTAVIFCMWRHDKNGTIHITYSRETFKLYTDAQNLPVFTLSGSAFGKWPLAGFFPTYDWKDGRKLPAEILFSLLDKHEDTKPYFYEIPNKYRIDKHVADVFSISRDQYPEDSIIINDDIQVIKLFWTEYKAGIIVVSGFVFIALILAATMLIYTFRIRKAKKQLAEVNEQLTKERKEWLDFYKRNNYKE